MADSKSHQRSLSIPSEYNDQQNRQNYSRYRASQLPLGVNLPRALQMNMRLRTAQSRLASAVMQATAEPYQSRGSGSSLREPELSPLNYFIGSRVVRDVNPEETTSDLLAEAQAGRLTLPPPLKASSQADLEEPGRNRNVARKCSTVNVISNVQCRRPFTRRSFEAPKLRNEVLVVGRLVKLASLVSAVQQDFARAKTYEWNNSAWSSLLPQVRIPGWNCEGSNGPGLGAYSSDLSTSPLLVTELPLSRLHTHDVGENKLMAPSRSQFGMAVQKLGYRAYEV
ncbi:hypothetical protein F4781DRAFT_434252 [Annulohypoxylon bovei var. microspora]|nr:hypothetical protein F4781DRAFT_434252 [Annulohypoxylon bovei var. microspora]